MRSCTNRRIIVNLLLQGGTGMIWHSTTGTIVMTLLLLIILPGTGTIIVMTLLLILYLVINNNTKHRDDWGLYNFCTSIMFINKCAELSQNCMSSPLSCRYWYAYEGTGTPIVSYVSCWSAVVQPLFSWKYNVLWPRQYKLYPGSNLCWLGLGTWGPFLLVSLPQLRGCYNCTRYIIKKSSVLGFLQIDE
jgi:hypothetical protein